MSTVSEKTRIPLGWAIALAVGLLGLAGTAATTKYQVGELKEGQTELRKEQASAKENSHRDDKRLQRMEDRQETHTQQLNAVLEYMRRLERKLDRER